MNNKYDDVLNPKHYTKYYPLQPIRVIEGTKMSFNIGQIFKYLIRAPYKMNELRDLQKAKFYLNWLTTDEINVLIKSQASQSLVFNFFDQAKNKEEITPLIFKEAFSTAVKAQNAQMFLNCLNNLIDQRIVVLNGKLNQSKKL